MTIKPRMHKKGTGTRTSRTIENAFAENRQVLGLVKKHRKWFDKADEKKQRKLITDALIRQFEHDRAIAEAAHAGHRVVITAGVQATAKEIEARKVVFSQLVDLRGDLELRLADHPGLRGAFGFCNRLLANSTPNLLGASQTALAAWNDFKDKALLAEAGIDQARMDALSQARTGLMAADASQAVERSERAGVVEKHAAIQKVRANTALIRRIAQHVLRNRPALLARFKSILPRHMPQKRKPTDPAKGETAPALTPASLTFAIVPPPSSADLAAAGPEAPPAGAARATTRRSSGTKVRKHHKDTFRVRAKKNARQRRTSA